jgi:hypothetical protein
MMGQKLLCPKEAPVNCGISPKAKLLIFILEGLGLELRALCLQGSALPLNPHI